MGYLLKEVLKNLCGVNHWSYAVFWKFGCQNPNLLTGEECYYETASCLKVHLLVEKMMNIRVSIVGEGLVGRVAFTGDHHWVLQDNYFVQAHPPEVLKEVLQQLSAGIQTVAVIPVLPHGVVQFGSKKKIMEDMGFVDEVRASLIQLGYIPGSLLSENKKAEKLALKMGVPVYLGNSAPVNLSLESDVIPSSLSASLTNVKNLPQASGSGSQTSSSLARENQNDHQSKLATFQSSNASLSHLKPSDFRQTALDEYKQDKNIFPLKRSLTTSEMCCSSQRSLTTSEMCCSSQRNSDSKISSSVCMDPPLNTVVSKDHLSQKTCLDDNVSCKTTLTAMSSTSAANTSLSYGQYRASKADSAACSQDCSIYRPQVSSWIEGRQNMKRVNSVSTGCSKKLDEKGKMSHKRLKPGENRRPRPEDRKMIEDYVKELRKIVPNGGKCSIEALLEHTIKHMLFLQSVMKHADKLKQTGESKDASLLLKNDSGGGATWAYEVGSQSVVSPLRVEDLNLPRQMLVKILCQERGLFFEIADIIKGLGLTILKGVVETLNDKIWAHFAIEANMDVTRMEVFCSLFRLLDQSAKICDYS